MEIGSKILGASDACKSFSHHFLLRPLVFFLSSRKATRSKKVELGPGVLEKRYYHLKATLDDAFLAEKTEEFLKELIGTVEKLIWRLKNQNGQSTCFAKVLNDPTYYDRRLGIVVAFNTQNQHAFLGREQIQEAIGHTVKGTVLVEESFYDGKKGDEEIQSYYFEIEKLNREPFKESEVKSIEEHFSFDLMDRVTLFSYPMFLPRNEEEVMRNMLQLSREIKFVKDLPHVIIQFRNQTHQKLIFDLILCKVRLDGDDTLADRLMSTSGEITFRFERNREMGGVRKKTIKDAYLFQVDVDIKSFLRRDLSVDLSRARQAILEKMKDFIGPLRDFNGGILSKEKELLVKTRYEILREKTLNEHLLENLFYSIQPYVIRTLVDPSLISEMYLLIDQGGFEENDLRYKEKKEGIVAVLRTHDHNRCLEYRAALEAEYQQAYDFGSLVYSNRDGYFLGLLFLSQDKTQREKFIKGLVQRTPKRDEKYSDSGQFYESKTP